MTNPPNGSFLAGPADWWRDAVVYQIYPRSFADGNGDGIGDLAGILGKVDYLSDLHLDAVWLSPFYPSQLADGGYDVDDYCDVDPRIGTLEEFDELLQALHGRGIRVFIDIVPNHSSNLHRWFVEALAARPGSPERERYIFREGRGASGELPPSDLISHFGPNGWTQVPDGQWYLHLFTKEQPDFNWNSPDVHAEFLRVLRFWSDRGVDGFRIDVAHGLAKDLEPLPSRSSFALPDTLDDGTDSLFDRDEVHDIYREWRVLFNEYDPPRIAVAEAYVHPHRRPAYASADGLGQAFNFDLLKANWDLVEYREVIDHNMRFSEHAGTSNTWVLSNHDVIRHATRLTLPAGLDEDAWYAGGCIAPVPDRELGLARARAASLLIMALPGSVYLYQGEELGLPEVTGIPHEQMQDPQWFRSSGKLKSRDGCRVPLPWLPDGPSFGFGAGGAHLPQPDWYAGFSVATEEADPESTLRLYRDALGLRRSLICADELTWLYADPGVLAFERPGGWRCVTNFGASAQPLPDGEVMISSAPIVEGLLPGSATAWLRML